MTRQSSLNRLRGTVSALALSTAAMVAVSAQPAAALDGIYGGGSSLVSLTMRQIMDCYKQATVLNDGYTFSSSFDETKPTPGLLPTSCPTNSVEGLYAAVGSGNGFRGFITNDPKQFFLGTPSPAVAMPTTPPPFIDGNQSGNPLFASYPYPDVDFGASDSPLSPVAAPTTASYSSFNTATNWCVTTSAGSTCTNVSAPSSSVFTYNTANWGAPIQLPLIEAPVAIAINTNNTGTATWSINSRLDGSGAPNGVLAGQAIQLTSAQLCAIFSGTVNDWNSTTPIAYIDGSGTLSTVAFNAANVGGFGSTATAYTNASLPIRVVFRSDGSGTSFIMQNYLRSVCPQLDDASIGGSNKYNAIFNAAPTTSFSALIGRITSATGVNVTAAGYNGGNPWIGADGSQGVAGAINNVASSGGTTYAGRIGYLSADFTQPYILPSGATPYAPLSASVQSEDQRANFIDVPDTTIGTTTPTFIPPTPAGADAAFAGLTAPGGGLTHAAWDLYAQTYPGAPLSGTTFSGGVDISGLSILGIPTTANSYPIVGTAYAALYSCYATDGGATNRAQRIKSFLTWFYTQPEASKVLENNSFHALNSTLASAITGVSGVISTIDTAGTGSCSGKSGA